MEQCNTAILISGRTEERERFEEAFRAHGWEAVGVDSVAEAIRAFATSQADAVLVSENLVGMSIITALRTLCEVYPHIPVVLVLPDYRLADFDYLPSQGILADSATAEEVGALINELPSMEKREPEAVRFRSSGMVDFETVDFDEVVLLTARRRLDLAGYADLEEKLNALAEAGRIRIVLDLSEVDALGSMSLAVMIRVWAELQNRGGVLVIAAPSEEAMRVIRLSNLKQLVGVYDTVEEAVRAARKERVGSGIWKAAVPQA